MYSISVRAISNTDEIDTEILSNDRALSRTTVRANKILDFIERGGRSGAFKEKHERDHETRERSCQK